MNLISFPERECAAAGQARPLRAIIRAKLVRLAAITAIFASMVALGLATTSNRVGSLTGNVHQISHLHDRTFWHSAWGAAFFGVAGLILGLLAAAQLSGGVTGPVSVFAKAAVDLTERPTDGEFPTGHRIVELNQFATALNRLLAAQRARLTELCEMSDNLMHDLNTPLANIRNEAELALDGERDATEALSRIHESSDYLLGAVETNARISSYAADLSNADAERLDFTAVVSQSTALYAFTAEAKGVVLAQEGLDGTHYVNAPLAKLQQLVGNLLDNAIKFTPKGGTVTVRLESDAESVTLTVADSGIGISANDLPRIFNRHFRADTSRHERGFGLGLALVKSIVDGCGGDIACASEPGRGTTFTVRLPAAAVVV